MDRVQTTHDFSTFGRVISYSSESHRMGDELFRQAMEEDFRKNDENFFSKPSWGRVPPLQVASISPKASVLTFSWP